MTTPFARNDQQLKQRAALLASLSSFTSPTSPTGVPRRTAEDYRAQYPGTTSQEEESTFGGLGSHILDLLSRGVYAGAGFAKESVKVLQGDEDSKNILGEAFKGLAGQEHNTYSDVIEEVNPDTPGWVKFAGGLAGDVLLDPANLVTGGIGTGVRAGVKATQAGKVAAKEAEKLANAAAKPLTKTEIKAMPKVPLNVRAQTDTTNKLLQRLDPVAQKVMSGHGFKQLQEMHRPLTDAAEDVMVKYRKDLKTINKEHNPQDVQDAMSAWKRQVVPVDPDVLEVYDKIIPGINRFADVKNDKYLASYLTDKAQLTALHDAMKSKGLKFRFDPLKATTNRNVGTALSPTIQKVIDPEKMVAQMRDWDIKDPLSFMDQMHQAVTHVKVLDATAKSLATLGKTTARPGMSKLSRTRGTVLGPYLPKDLYFDHEIAHQITRMEDMLKQPTNWKDSKSKLGWTINNVVTPAMNIWKPLMTIANPAHHVRNVYSDIIINSMDGMNSVGAYRKAKRMLSAGGAYDKMGIPGIKELENGVGVPGSRKMTTARLKGSNVDISDDEMYKLGWNQGLYVNHHGTEDLLDSATAKQAGRLNAHTGQTNRTVTSTLLDNKWMQNGAKISEYTNHYIRGAHFIGLMESKKFTRQFATKEEAAAAAATRVKKYHPDLHGLTPWERKNARLLVPFYNWQRQVLPRIMNTAVSKPGRVTALPKANYELAKAMGMEPNSISDQFDENGIFPSFVHENLLGPVANVGGMAVGASTGSPQEALFGDVLNGNLLKNAYSMSNPIGQFIVEGLSGVDPSTGRPIRDKSDWLDSQVPVVNKLSKLSGYSPSSIIEKLLQGDIGIDETADKTRGTYNPALQGANWVTGLGLTNYNNSTYRNIAMKERTE